VRIGAPLIVKIRNGMQPSRARCKLAPVVQSVLANVREQVLATPGFDPTSACRRLTIAMSDFGEKAG
jgi:DNA-binding transcriptional LysR family regulator